MLMSKKLRFCLVLTIFWIGAGWCIKGFAQVGLTGSTTVVYGSSYTYYPTYNGSSSYSYTGTYSYSITGGSESSTGNMYKSGTCSSVLYSIGINITWTTSGYLQFSSGLGSATLTVTVVPALQPGAISPSSQTINYGTVPSAITGTAASGGAATPAYQYQWQSSPDNVSWAAITGATSQNYSPGLMYNTTYFRRMVTETTTSAVAYTSSVLVTVYPQLACTIGPSSQTIASGSTAATLTSSVNGGNGVYAYQWQISPDNSTWTNAATTASYSPGALTATKYYRLIVTSNGASVTSNTATVTVNSTPTGTLAIVATTRSGNGSINTLSCAASSGNGSYTYAWYASTNGGSTYQLISTAAGSYTTGVITTTTQFYVAVTSNGLTGNSNIVTIPIPSAPSISTNATLLCNGAAATLTASGSSGTYTWYNAANTQVGTGSTYTTTAANTYYATSTNAYGVSGSSNTITITTSSTPAASSILGNTFCVLGSTTQLAHATSGGTWSSSNAVVAKVDGAGVVTGTSAGNATITYTLTNACGTSSQQLGITVVPFSVLSQSLGTGIADPVATDTISLVPNTSKSRQFQQDTLYSSAHTIKNVIAFRVVEETVKYIPGDFTASAVMKIEYGHTPNDIYQIDSIVLTVNYRKHPDSAYNAIKYLYFNNAEFIRVTVLRVDAPTVVGSVSFDTKQVLQLTNSLIGTRFYQLADNKRPALSYTSPPTGFVPDALAVTWTYPLHTNNNYTQLEWTWLEDSMQYVYTNGNSFDTSLLFRNGATRIDLPGGATVGNYAVPLLYNGPGKLFMRVRGVNMMPSGSRSDGPWSGVRTFAFKGHNDTLNWQATTTYAEEGKRKAVVQYFDGSLRSRQTVTKDSTTKTTVVAETFYDGQGRPAIEILPSPTLNQVIAYTRNFNKFKTQPDNNNPLDYFDFTTTSLGRYATMPLDTTASGAARYYSGANPEKNTTSYNKNIPAANGFAYAATRYTADATGRVMMQSGVGDSLQMGGGHATRYYYGTAAQEELDALFGTEVGNYTHYFKNMVQDANGQMSVSYEDMHGRTIATALAGDAPASTQALSITDTTVYKNQAGKLLTRNLLDKGSNILKGAAIESVNAILVPVRTTYTFDYTLPKQVLQLPKCGGGTVSYNCKFDLQISIGDEGGDSDAKVYNYPGIDTIKLQISLPLSAGSYSVRKTLTINQDSLSKFLLQYNTLNVGLCRSQQFLVDSIAALDSVASGCKMSAVALTCKTCLDSLGTYAAYKYKYAISIGVTDTTKLSASQQLDIRNQYLSDSSFCASLNLNTSRTLASLQQQMLADMVPYSGQYAKATGSGTMYNKYNIFSPSGNPGFAQPFYKRPLNRALTADNYYDAFGQIDTGVMAGLSTMSMVGFEQAFSNSWATSLLPYHPEFKKLKYAQDNLQASYDFIDSLNQSVPAAFNPVLSDPFFTSISPGADKDSMTRYSTQMWMNSYSMWQMAYGDAFGCKVMTDTTARKTCYANMPKQFTITGTAVNTGSGTLTLSATIQSQAWGLYKGFYTLVRGEMVNKYISLKTDTADNRNLISQGYKIYFPYNNVQQSQNSGWTTWYPNQNGAYPAVNLVDSVKAATSPCNNYITAWQLALLQCPKLPADTAVRNRIVGSITDRMLLVCKSGTDAANPLGSSTVAPAYAGATYTSFEQVVKKVFDSLGISGLSCNPYNIEFPKPYGLNAVISRQFVAGVDTCTCTQFARLKSEITAGGGSIASLATINQYLWTKYKDTIPPVLYQALQQCGQPYLYNCRQVTDTVQAHDSYYLSYRTVCDTLYAFPLSTPQLLPVFLTCGFSKSSVGCYSCTTFKSLDSSFFTLYGKHPVFAGTVSNTDTVIAYNNLFANYVNFKTGLQYTWQYYAGKFSAAKCGIGGLTDTTNSQLAICLDSKPLNDTTGLLAPLSPCQQVRNRAVVKAALVYEASQQQLIAGFQAAYLAKCLSANEVFTATDTIKEYHYTLYYYDQAGNLIKTVPPKGVNPIYRSTFIDSVERFKLSGSSLTPTHSLITRYCYNSLNQVILQKSPDGGASRFWYDRLGRLVLSQNAKQASSGNVYSYTFYDSLGRITQVGQLTGGTVMNDAVSRSDASLQAWLSAASASRNQITQTVYDTAYAPISAAVLSQQNLRNRVSYSQVMNGATDIYPATSTYYCYDIHGNVDTLLQDFGNSSGIRNAMNASGNRFKKVVYNYDLISGKVNGVSYQPGQPDAYYHRYAYDAENRITDVYSGRDSIMLFLFPEREAHYTYYKHGPLARTDLGQLRVQGLDYAYTLQGWLKGVNPAMGGTLANGTDTTEAFPVAQDVFGFSLHYYRGDYRAVGYTPQVTSIIGALGSSAAPFYNGNIATMAVNLPKFGAAKVYNYHYDQLNRLVAMDVYNGLSPTAGTFSPISLSDYRERVTYDPSGNILTYNRHGDAARLSMDSLSYFYKPNTNQLHKVVDVAANNASYNDLKTGQLDNNYTYDAIGNLTSDNSETISNITWNVYGKIASVTKAGAGISYVYDASGNRILKLTASDTTAYVRDAQGNVLSVYVKKAGATSPVLQTEVHLYGSSRLGMVTQHLVKDSTLLLNSAFGIALKGTFSRREKFFELSNHLGNVLVTISDRRTQNSAGGVTVDSYAANVVSTQDYYPFGMMMPGRAWNNSYRYGFNGKENDAETSTQDYGMRIYNPILCKFFSVDPLSPKYPWLSPYQFASNSPIMGIDLDGGEFKDAIKNILRWSLGVPSLNVKTKIDVARGFYNRAKGTLEGFQEFFTKLSEASSIDIIPNPLERLLPFNSTTLVPFSNEEMKCQAQFFQSIPGMTYERISSILNEYGTLIKKTIDGDGEAAGALLFDALAAAVPVEEIPGVLRQGVRQFSKLEKVVVQGSKTSALARIATHNGEARKVMLGKFIENSLDSYIERAGSEYTYFDLKHWQETIESNFGGDLNKMWNVNKKFIDNQIAGGKDFFFSHNPEKAKGILKKEVDYLKTKGFNSYKQIAKNLWQAVKE